MNLQGAVIYGVIYCEAFLGTTSRRFMTHATRQQIENFANDAFSVARDRILADYAQKLSQVRRTGNRGAYLPARIELEKERLRTLILARADAWLEAFELFGVPSDAQAEKDLQTCALQMAGGSIAAVRGDLRLRAGRLRIAEEGRGIPWHLEIERSMNTTLKEGALRLRRQQVTSKYAKGPSQRELPAEGRAEAPPKRPGTAVPSSNKASLKPTFPKRASWLKERLRERSWNKHDLARQRGPDHKTTQKVLGGLSVREDVLEKLATALSRKVTKVAVLDIPQD